MTMDELSVDLQTNKPPQIARRARIYCSSHDHHGPQPLYTAIVTKARQAKLAGATVFKGIEGFGAHDLIHASGIADIASESPIVIELIDTVEKIEAFIAEVEHWLGAAMITFEDINVVFRAAKAP
jgi:PII-like signaling protein